MSKRPSTGSGRTGALRVLISAGPTREYLDPVRFLSNDSSGKMSFALAHAAITLGCSVTLVAGPVTLSTPPKAKRIDVISAAQMRAAMLKAAPKHDLIIMAAAVCDWSPQQAGAQKMKRGAQKTLKLTLIASPDILQELSQQKRPGQIIAGFSLETERVIENARKKLKQKQCDWIIANRHTNIGADIASATLLSRDGESITLPRLHKQDLAFLILSHLLPGIRGSALG